MVHGTSAPKFRRVRLAGARAPSTEAALPRALEMNPFLYTPEEYAQRRMRHGGTLVAPAQFVPLDSARHLRATRMALRKRQLARAASDAVRDAEIARAIAKAVRREKHARAVAAAAAQAGVAVQHVAVQHVVSTGDVIFATPEAAQLLCGDQDVEWVDVDSSSDGEADAHAHRRQSALRHRKRFARSKARRGVPRARASKGQHSAKMRR